MDEVWDADAADLLVGLDEGAADECAKYPIELVGCLAQDDTVEYLREGLDRSRSPDECVDTGPHL